MTAPKKTSGSKPASPAKVEVEAEDSDDLDTVTISINVRGTDIDLKLPASFEVADPDAIVAMEEEKPTVAFKALIGAQNWSQLKRMGWNAGHFQTVVKEWQEAVGLGNG